MYTTWDIYCIYRQAQADVNNRGYRLPKDWKSHWENKFNKTQKENLQKITDYFNTKWSDIDPYRYFKAGFEIYKNFTYHQFLDKKVVEMYKRLDKLEKRKLDASKKAITESVKYVIKEMEDIDTNSVGPLRYYCRMKEDGLSKPIKDYIDNKVSTPFVTWLIYERYLILPDTERSMIPFVTSNYRNLVANLNNINSFLQQMKRKVAQNGKKNGY